MAETTLQSVRLRLHGEIESAPPSPVRRALRFGAYQSGPLAVVVTSLCVWPIFGRLLPATEIGSVTLLLTVASLTSPILCLGLNLHGTNVLARNRTSEVRALMRALSIALATAGVLAGAFGVAVHAWPLGALAVSAASASSLLVIGSARGLDRPAQYAGAVAVTQVGGVALLCIGVLVTRSDLIAALIFAAGMFIVAATSGRGLSEAPVAILHALMATLRPALQLVPHLVLAVAMMLGVRLVIRLECGPAALGHFQFAALLIGATLTVGASLNANWSISALTSKTRVELQEMLRRQQWHIQLALCGVAVGLVIFTLTVLPHWLPPSYALGDTVRAVALALPAAALQASADGRATAAMWNGHQRAVSVGTLVGVTCTAVSAGLMLPAFGWSVAGLAISLGFAARCAVMVAAVPPPRSGSLSALRTSLAVMLQMLIAAALLLTVPHGGN